MVHHYGEGTRVIIHRSSSHLMNPYTVRVENFTYVISILCNSSTRLVKSIMPYLCNFSK